jgi:hypothetical protein
MSFFLYNLKIKIIKNSNIFILISFDIIYFFKNKNSKIDAF